MGLAKKKNEAYHNHKHSIGNTNARSMNNFLNNTEPLTMSNTKALNDSHQLNASGVPNPAGPAPGSVDMKQMHERKNVVAAIYLNTMSQKAN